MIGKLKGKIDSYSEDAVIIDVGGVGYHVFCSARTLAKLPETGMAAELVIETHVREEHIHLLGFPDADEREWFRTLTTVQGVGVKMALAVLGVYSPAELAHIIAAKDTKTLTRISGVGPKLAERITTELKNKVAKLPTGVTSATVKNTHSALPKTTIGEDAISALINLGYNRANAYNAVTAALSGGKDASSSIDTVIKESLRYLAN